MKKFLVFLGIIAAVTIVSCSKDDDKPSVEENKATLNNIDQVVNQNYDSLSKTDGGVAFLHMMDLMSKSDPFNTPTKSTIDIKTRFRQAFIPSFKSHQVMEDRFVLSDHVGTYSWNATYEAWDVQHGEPSDAIVIEFPSDSTQTGNNAVFTLSNYTDAEFVDSDGYTSYQPTAIQANLKLNGTEIAHVDFSASYGSTSVPTSISVDLYLQPASFYLALTNNGSKITVKNYLKMNGDKIESIDAYMNYTETDNEITPTLIHGYIQFGPVKLSGEIDIAGLKNLYTQESVTVDDINKEISLAIYNYPEGSKIADIKYYQTSEEIPFEFVFTDGTTANVQPYLQKFEETLQEKLSAFEGK